MCLMGFVFKQLCLTNFWDTVTPNNVIQRLYIPLKTKIHNCEINVAHQVKKNISKK